MAFRVGQKAFSIQAFQGRPLDDSRRSFFFFLFLGTDFPLVIIALHFQVLCTPLRSYCYVLHTETSSSSRVGIYHSSRTVILKLAKPSQVDLAVSCNSVRSYLGILLVILEEYPCMAYVYVAGTYTFVKYLNLTARINTVLFLSFSGCPRVLAVSIKCLHKFFFPMFKILTWYQSLHQTVN